MSTFDPTFGPARASPAAPETKSTTAAEANNRSKRPLDIANYPSKTCQNLTDPKRNSSYSQDFSEEDA